MRIRKSVATIAALMLVPSCGTPSSSVPAGQLCPRSWQAGVLWSTEAGSSSELVFVADDRPVARRAVPYVGFGAVPGSVEDRSGTEVVMASNGNQSRDKTHLVSFSTDDCAVTSRQVPEQVVLGVAAGHGVTYATNAPVDTGAQLRRRDPHGNVTAEARFRNLVLGKLLLHGDTLYAFGANYADPKRPAQLLVLDATTLAEKHRVALRATQGAIDQAVVKNGKLYYPQTIVDDKEGTRLGIIDPATFEQSTVELNAPAPFLIVDAGDHLWIGHTYINPSFRELTDYRWVTRYNPASGKVDRFDVGVGVGVTSLAVKDQTLYVLGTAGDEDHVKLRIIDLPDMKLRTEVDITKPDRPGHFYPSTLIMPA